MAAHEFGLHPLHEIPGARGLLRPHRARGAPDLPPLLGAAAARPPARAPLASRRDDACSPEPLCLLNTTPQSLEEHHRDTEFTEPTEGILQSGFFPNDLRELGDLRVSVVNPDPDFKILFGSFVSLW